MKKDIKTKTFDNSVRYNTVGEALQAMTSPKPKNVKTLEKQSMKT